MRHDSLWLFLPNNLTRRLLFIISMHKYYRIACAITTVIACAVYAAEPAGDDPLSARAGELSYVDMLINLFFGYELGIKARRMIVGMLQPWLTCARLVAGCARRVHAPRQRASHPLRLARVCRLCRGPCWHAGPAARAPCAALPPVR
jgi:hypothetical protein